MLRKLLFCLAMGGPSAAFAIETKVEKKEPVEAHLAVVETSLRSYRCQKNLLPEQITPAVLKRLKRLNRRRLPLFSFGYYRLGESFHIVVGVPLLDEDWLESLSFAALLQNLDYAARPYRHSWMLAGTSLLQGAYLLSRHIFPQWNLPHEPVLGALFISMLSLSFDQQVKNELDLDVGTDEKNGSLIQFEGSSRDPALRLAAARLSAKTSDSRVRLILVDEKAFPRFTSELVAQEGLRPLGD